MAEKSRSTVIRQLRFVVASWKEDTRTDVDLLRRFIQERDEQAFTTLVGRHSELVWGVCLRVLRNPADAEDALQATFLRLARDAKRIINKEALGGWLFRVARDCSIDLQRAIARQRRIEERVAEVAPHNDGSAANDLRVLLDDELAQLSQSERAVLVLCCLEGRTYADAALELGCSTAAVHRRFVRAQTRLRRRFAQHGKTATKILAAVLTGAALPAASAAPPALLARTVETGLAVARTGALPATRAGAFANAAPSVVANGTNRTGFAVALLAISVVLVGCAVALMIPPELPQAPTLETEPPPIASSTRAQTTVTGVVRGPKGELVAGASVVALARRPFGPGERGLRDEVIATTQTGADGRFALNVFDDFDTWFTGRVVTVQASGPNFAPATLPVRLRPSPGEVELTLAAASDLRGKLLDEAGRAAVGVRVEVVRIGDAVAEPVVGRAESASPPAWPKAVVSGADGTFAFPALGGAENVWVRVLDPRFALDVFRIDGVKPGSLGEFRLDRACSLTVEVRAGDTDAVLPGARVTVITDPVSAHPHFCATDHGILSPRSIPADIDAVTDNRGRVRVNLTPRDQVEVLVHPLAESGPYVGVRTRVEIATASTDQRLVVRVPRGRWVTGTVTDENGKLLAGAAVHWGHEASTLPEWKDDVLVGRDAITRTGPDGAFALPVLPGACSVRVYGPTPDFETVSAKLPGTTHTTIFAHHIARIEMPEPGAVQPVKATLRSARSINGTVLHPVADSGTTILLASGRVSPVRGYAALPVSVRGGAFSVPGCREGYTTRAYLLDPVARTGAVADVSPGTSASNVPLRACGTIRLRVLDSKGKPKAGQDVGLSLLVERDRTTDSNARERAADAQPVEWFDATNYPTRPKTNADGVAELSALIPGSRYAVTVGSGANRVALGKFAIEPGKTITIPDVVLPGPSEGGTQ
ncbi:ECF RNA polymerase sigma factor SigE [Gemmata sp. SH-PL17]|uniref:sigma-70 family RNA polymerase sigma factor n=1 Tax=Gemmata sp. SH-PL17 TaxID=1630693 RepID=UPI00078B2B71|nr:sigma-70 family RNA polymerase sigma factor [Gemmata sp. SH-PL17]AMV26191.1 ECF RNA polymerase sigma factor SigE [Gemmata sp. SH-PL17]